MFFEGGLWGRDFTDPSQDQRRLAEAVCSVLVGEAAVLATALEAAAGLQPRRCQMHLHVYPCERIPIRVLIRMCTVILK